MHVDGKTYLSAYCIQLAMTDGSCSCRERIHSASWGCLGSVRVEHHRPRYVEGDVWWKRELKVLVSVPVIVLFASLLAILLTAIFVLEAFVTDLYTGPGHRYMVS